MEYKFHIASAKHGILKNLKNRLSYPEAGSRKLNQKMTDYLLVFLGGGLGSMLRLGLSKYNTVSATILPLGTITANILSSLAFGALIGWVSNRTNIPPSFRIFFGIGFCGGFSTFSTFSFETFYFLKTGQPIYAFLNVGLSLVGCLLGIYSGYSLTK